MIEALHKYSADHVCFPARGLPAERGLDGDRPRDRPSSGSAVRRDRHMPAVSWKFWNPSIAWTGVDGTAGKIRRAVAADQSFTRSCPHVDACRQSAPGPQSPSRPAQTPITRDSRVRKPKVGSGLVQPAVYHNIYYLHLIQYRCYLRITYAPSTTTSRPTTLPRSTGRTDAPKRPK